MAYDKSKRIDRLYFYQKFLEKKLNTLSFKFQDVDDKNNYVPESKFDNIYVDPKLATVPRQMSVKDYVCTNMSNLKPSNACFQAYSNESNHIDLINSLFLFRQTIVSKSNGIQRLTYTCIDNRILNAFDIYAFNLNTDTDFVENKIESFINVLKTNNMLGLLRLITHHVNNITIIVRGKNLRDIIAHNTNTLNIDHIIINHDPLYTMSKTSEYAALNQFNFETESISTDHENIHGNVDCSEQTLKRLLKAYSAFNPKCNIHLLLPYKNHVIHTSIYGSAHGNRSYRNTSPFVMLPENHYEGLDNDIQAEYVEENNTPISSNSDDENLFKIINHFLRQKSIQIIKYMYLNYKIDINHKNKPCLIGKPYSNKIIKQLVETINQNPNLLINKTTIFSSLNHNNLIYALNENDDMNVKFDQQHTSLGLDYDIQTIYKIVKDIHFQQNINSNLRNIRFTLTKQARKKIFTKSESNAIVMPATKQASINGTQPITNNWQQISNNKNSLFGFIATLNDAGYPTIYQTHSHLYVTSPNDPKHKNKLISYDQSE